LLLHGLAYLNNAKNVKSWFTFRLFLENEKNEENEKIEAVELINM